MRGKQAGFTLIEIAIVLVIIGLLLGGVLKGQELITNARVRNIIAQQDGIKAAYFGFQDRYRGIPGDYTNALAQQNIPGVSGATCGSNCGGDGDGIIEAKGASAATSENLLAWFHLSKAGFMSGSFVTDGAETTTTTANSPTNPFGGYLQIIFDNVYNPGASNPVVANIKTGPQLPATVLAEVDRKIDDGSPNSGAFRFSSYSNADTACVNTSTTPASWDVTSGKTNCGGTSLF